MTHAPARERRTDERRRQILIAAREQAEAGGWAAVTTRRLADAIGYTQPVLYGHFPGGKAQIMLAVAMTGFVELERECRSAIDSKRGRAAVEAVAVAYLEFGADHPAVYEAMFQQPIAATFASEDSEAELRAGFAVLAEAVGDTEGMVTEVFWAALHGLCLLERASRIRLKDRPRRVAELASRFAPPGDESRPSQWKGTP